MNTIKIDFPSIQENIRIVESFIDNAKEKYQLTDEIYGNIMVAVTESVNNAIQHGNKNIKDKNVYLSLIFTEGSIQFEVEDEGDGFDYETLPDPTAPENIDKPGGRGIFLMKHLSDEVAFEQEGKKVILTFYLN
ncbi:ATP-binding protein [Marinigracilibium pacificum]|uniref:ATP-binding protein n=1 Tax=Marinigracilibium pacificum TaxID=2729599 RepID=A0A848IRL8_9BACT|nr:ATP-binding protein [Marinigracilibium pacificum]NMM46997.1 ATP-binding protein [Marinigracilibium pacificum]